VFQIFKGVILNKQIKLISIGECMLEVQANNFGSAVLAYGGDTFNTAVYLRRCSPTDALQVGYATGVGNDPLSDKLLNEWSAVGLDLKCTQKIEGKLPGMYLIETDDTGERRFHFWRENSAARYYFEAHTTPLETMAKDIDCFYFSGISLAILSAVARERLFKLLQEQKNAGKTIVFDNNYRPKLWPDRTTTQKVFNQAFALSTIALITADDHKDVFGLASLEEAVSHAQQLNIQEIVIKRGSSQTLVHSHEQHGWTAVDTQVVSNVIDTTAAGDSFAAGYLSRRLLGQTAIASAAFGNLVASRVVQHRGAIIPIEAMKDLM
jgi:2-dehydro-3-deoxygluconokinase